MFNYKPLWDTMKEQKITTYTLINTYGINPRTINNLKHNNSITMYTLERLCQILFVSFHIMALALMAVNVYRTHVKKGENQSDGT